MLDTNEEMELPNREGLYVGLFSLMLRSVIKQ